MDAATLGFSVQDFLLRSSAALYLPAGVLLCAALAGVLVHYLVAAAADADPGAGASVWARRVRRGCRGLTVVAVLCLLLGLSAGFGGIDAGALGTPLLIGGGLVLVLYARVLSVRSTGAPYPVAREKAALAVLAALIALCSFWAVGAFAQEKGRREAQRMAGNLALRPAVVLDTTERLYLQWPGVEERQLPGAGAEQRFKYRYRGLRLLTDSDHRLFLVSQDWTWRDGNVLVVPVDDRVRVAFHPG
ncbi:hypothetical protein GCM10020229_15920 [Kitasatospora albolonga]|uniref:hypothetical protein n=1 Tax=Kitasatospora albolonga TaxID=68173 RepID=UPI0031EE0C33